jgi:uncharacterized protein
MERLKSINIMNKKNILLFLFTCCFLLSCSPSGNDRVIMIPMRDGINLSTKLIFPKSAIKKYPVIFIRTPYKKERLSEYYNYLVQNGYVLAIQDVRGRFNSEGTFEPFINESKDGYDAIEWIAAQEWCDGNIGMIGTSYDGWVQYCAAIEKPPHLKTIIPNCSPIDLFYDAPYRNGIFTAYLLPWVMGIEENATADLTGKKMQEIYSKNWEELLNYLPLSELDKRIFSKRIDYYQKWIQHDSRDYYWKQACSLEKLKEIKIPVFIQSGWFDSQLLHSKLVYNELKKSGNKNIKMIIGPWGHGDRESKYYNGIFIGERAADINLQTQYIRWFDHWLKNKENGIIQEPMVNLYSLNSDKWYNDNTYPLKITSYKKIFLSSSGEANLNGNNGKLTFDGNKIKPGFDRYSYDPNNVILYKNEMNRNTGILKKLITGRSDHLFYKSEPFDKPTTILGPIYGRIYASSSAFDTDWFVILVILDNNNNFIENISYGMLRARFRNSFDKPELLEKNNIYPFEIDLNHFGITLEKGQKIGVIITSSFLYPYYTRNLNTGKNNQTETDYIVAEQKIFHTKEYPSYISLPILENKKSKDYTPN